MNGLAPADRRLARRGFTLVEMLVVIAVAAILAMIAVPSFQQSILMNRADTASNQFAAVLSMARSEAVKQGGTGVSVCLYSGTLPCAPAAVGGVYNWSVGWSVCCAPGSAAAGTPVSVQTGAALTAPMSNWGTTQTISFDSMGRLPVNSATLTFMFCPDGVDATKAYLVTVAPSGRVRVVTPVNGQPPVNDNGTSQTSCTAPSSL